MALVWQKTANGVCYEVRTAGRNYRLYTNGIFHSQYNPKQPLTGGVWDLLMLPSFFLAPGKIKNVLVLGVGGGAVIHQLFAYVKPAHVVGIEKDATHLRIAKRFFDLDYRSLTLHVAEAQQWLKDYRGDKFDVIIEDLFLDQDGEPERAIAIDKAWMDLLNRHLSDHGVLIMNCLALKQIRQAMAFFPQVGRSSFRSAYRFDSTKHANIIAAFIRQATNQRLLKSHLRALADLDDTKASCRLDYSVRSIGRFLL